MISDDLITCPVKPCAWRTEVSSEDADASLSAAVDHVRSHGFEAEEALAAIHEIDERGSDAALEPVSDETREQWLHRAVEALRPLFTEADIELPPVHVSVGWPSTGGLGKKRRVVGECWKRIASDDEVNQIFISPVRGKNDTAEVLETLVHELIHAVDDCEHGHKNDFVAMAKSVGLVGPWTATSAGDELKERFVAIIKEIGSIPSAALHGGAHADAPKPQKNRQVKAECINGTGYKVRLTRKWIDEVGPPICACCQVPMEIELPPDDEDDES